jgi:hypothetical protein
MYSCISNSAQICYDETNEIKLYMQWTEAKDIGRA